MTINAMTFNAQDDEAPGTFLTAALEYAKQGLPVFALQPREKKPRKGTHGCKDATTDAQQIAEWWQQFSDANIGIATGSDANVFVLDVDVGIGKGGAESLAALEAEHGPLPRTLMVRTGTNGCHYYFRYPEGGIKNSAGGLGAGLDIRGDGGYVVAPPSIHPDTGQLYSWEIDAPVAEAPAWLLDLLRQSPKVTPMPSDENTIPDGQRNSKLASIAGTLRRQGFDEAEIVDALLDINERRCDPPLPPKEIQQIGKSIARYPIDGAFPLTDLGNSERLVARHGEDFLFCPPWGSWLVWDGTRWQKDETGEIMRRAKETVRAIRDEAAAIADKDLRKEFYKHAKRSEARARLEAMVKLAEMERAIRPEKLDAGSWLFNVRNGTVNLKTGELQPHDRRDYLTKIAPVAYDAVADASRWDEFLREVMAGDEKLIQFLQRLIGYSLTGDTSEHAMFVLYGSGANGKSTFLETLHTVFGDYAQKAETRTLLHRDFDGVRNDIAKLRGARFVSAVEVGRGQRLNEQLVKEITGGDRISARFLYKEFFEFVPAFKLFLACNHKPEIRGSDEGIWRRVSLVPFTVFIPPENRDKKLQSKLEHECSGILNWALEGLRAWQSGGLEPPQAVIEATNEYRREMDLLADFLESSCEVSPDGEVAVSELYAAYETYCADNGEQPVKIRTFGVMMSERGFRSEPRTRRGKSVRHYLGLYMPF